MELEEGLEFPNPFQALAQARDRETWRAVSAELALVFWGGSVVITQQDGFNCSPSPPLQFSFMSGKKESP